MANILLKNRQLNAAYHYISIFSFLNSTSRLSTIISKFFKILSLDVPDKNGDKRDVALGFGDLDDYTTSTVYFGALIGRCANRIQEAVIKIDGKEYNLAKNDGNNHLHGGNKGFDKQVWHSTIKEDEQGEYLELTYLSKDKEENYPGNLNVTVNYRLNNNNELVIEYKAKSDKDTVVNLTNHSYFNLAGQESGDILNHKLKIYGSTITTADEQSIPRGEIRNIKDTPMDFTEFRVVGESIDDDYDQLNNGHGYDHNWIIDGEEGKLNMVAEVIEDTSGIKMDVYSTMPGVQFYSGNFLEGQKGKNGAVYKRRAGLCLETQYYPNALVNPEFPSTILKAGEEYNHTTIYKFTTNK